jgi:hypothetical protein
VIEKNGWMMSRWARRLAAAGASLSLAWLGLPFVAHAVEAVVPSALARFSDSGGALPASWHPLTFPKIDDHTRYRMVRDPENAAWVIEATSSASASGLIHSCNIDLREHPVLRWRWKVEAVLSNGDARRKDGDDYAARIYLSFEPAPEQLTFWERTSLALARAIYGDVPSRAINYLWANRLEKGATVDSPYVGKFVKLVAVQSGAGEAGRWHTQERDVFADYRRLFGADPPPVVGVAIMTDSDDTGEQAHAWYGDVEFVSRSMPR